jgi:hypothetical protein
LYNGGWVESVRFEFVSLASCQKCEREVRGEGVSVHTVRERRKLKNKIKTNVKLKAQKESGRKRERRKPPKNAPRRRTTP